MFLISLQVVLIAICLVSGGYLFYHMVYVPQRNRQMVEKLKEEFPEETDLPGETPPKEKNSPAGEEKVLLVDLLALQDRYPDIQGWLTIPDTNIDYPVLQGSKADPERYLHRNYAGEWNVNGSLFLQWDCDVSGSQNLVVYGHNMNSGEMFGNLDKYCSVEYYKDHGSVFFQSLSGVSEYEVVAILKADVFSFPFQRVDLSGIGGISGYIRQAEE